MPEDNLYERNMQDVLTTELIKFVVVDGNT